MAFPTACYVSPVSSPQTLSIGKQNKILTSLKCAFSWGFDWLDSFPKLLVMLHHPPIPSITSVSREGKTATLWPLKEFEDIDSGKLVNWIYLACGTYVSWHLDISGQLVRYWQSLLDWAGPSLIDWLAPLNLQAHVSLTTRHTCKPILHFYLYNCISICICICIFICILIDWLALLNWLTMSQHVSQSYTSYLYNSNWLACLPQLTCYVSLTIHISQDTHVSRYNISHLVFGNKGEYSPCTCSLKSSLIHVVLMGRRWGWGVEGQKMYFYIFGIHPS